MIVGVFEGIPNCH